jgi:hypothetical protein
MEWAPILAYITGTVDQELLPRNEYLVAENRILKSLSKGRLKLSDVERTKLGEIGHRLGRKALGDHRLREAGFLPRSAIRLHTERASPIQQRRARNAVPSRGRRDRPCRLHALGNNLELPVIRPAPSPTGFYNRRDVQPE